MDKKLQEAFYGTNYNKEIVSEVSDVVKDTAITAGVVVSIVALMKGIDAGYERFLMKETRNCKSKGLKGEVALKCGRVGKIKSLKTRAATLKRAVPKCSKARNKRACLKRLYNEIAESERKVMVLEKRLKKNG